MSEQERYPWESDGGLPWETEKEYPWETEGDLPWETSQDWGVGAGPDENWSTGSAETDEPWRGEAHMADWPEDLAGPEYWLFKGIDEEE